MARHARRCRVCCAGCCALSSVVCGAVSVFLFALSVQLVSFYRRQRSVILLPPFEGPDEPDLSAAETAGTDEGDPLEPVCHSPVSQAEVLEQEALFGFLFTVAVLVWVLWTILVVVALFALFWPSVLSKLKAVVSTLDYSTPPLDELNAVPAKLVEDPRSIGGYVTLVLIVVILVAVPYTLVTNYFLVFQTAQSLTLLEGDVPPFRAEVIVTFGGSLSASSSSSVPPDVGAPCAELLRSLSAWKTDGTQIPKSSRIVDVRCRPSPNNASTSGALSFAVETAEAESPFRVNFAVPPAVQSFSFAATSFVSVAESSDPADVLTLTDAFSLRILGAQTYCDKNLPTRSAPVGIGVVPADVQESWSVVTLKLRLEAVCRSAFLSTKRTARVEAYAIQDVSNSVEEVPWGVSTNSAAFTSLGRGNRTVNWIAFVFDVPSAVAQRPKTLCSQDKAGITTVLLQCLALIGSLLGLRLVLRGVLIKVSDRIGTSGDDEDASSSMDGIADAEMHAGGQADWKRVDAPIEDEVDS
jgi:hypothetical protein